MNVFRRASFFSDTLSLSESLVQFHYRGTWNAVLAVNKRYATMDFSSSYSSSSQKSQYLFFFTFLHHWTYPSLTLLQLHLTNDLCVRESAVTVFTRVTTRGHFSNQIREVTSEIKFQWYQYACSESYA